jgi:uncharacterized membrane protein
MANSSQEGGFPVSAGILFGLGLGGFFDGIILHQTPLAATDRLIHDVSTPPRA